MRGVSSKAMEELQTIYKLADIQIDLCDQKVTQNLLKQIQINAKKIKKITGIYNK